MSYKVAKLISKNEFLSSTPIHVLITEDLFYDPGVIEDPGKKYK